MKAWFFFFWLPLFFSNLLPKEKISSNRKLIILSIDGLPGFYLQPNSSFLESTPVLKNLLEISDFNLEVQSVYPTLTYPAHTSMMTGVDPAIHKIFFNSPIDWKQNLGGDWYWFDEDISVKTLWDFTNELGLKTASIYWPVTVGAKIKYNVPQFWKNKTEYDVKLLRALSTRGMYKYLEKVTNVQVGEFSGDSEKILFAIEAWKKYKPDLLLVYTTDLDTIHHSHGVYSQKARETLVKIDSLVGKFLEEINLFKNPNLGFMIVSDHGFKKVEKICYPNNAFLENSKTNWKYKFKTLGGVGILLKQSSVSDLNRESLEKLQQKIQENCPGSNAVFEGEKYLQLKQEFYADTQMFLYTTEAMSFSEGKGNWLQVLKSSYYNHGFIPEDSEMKTVNIFFPKGRVTKKIQSVKDVLMFSCEWLEINCKVGEIR
jgi:predicted AlkP superfamily pyrophosphatase or phosphodiesterase